MSFSGLQNTHLSHVSVPQRLLWGCTQDVTGAVVPSEARQGRPLLSWLTHEPHFCDKKQQLSGVKDLTRENTA